MLFHYILLPLTITLASAETSLDPRPSRILRHPLATPSGPLSSPFDHRRRPALFYYLEPLSAAREFTRGTHYWGVYSAVTVALATRLSPFFLLLRPSLPSFFGRQTHRSRISLSTRHFHSRNFYSSPFTRELETNTYDGYMHERRGREMLM